MTIAAVQPAQKTPLHAWHLSHGAKMADFGGYHMPIWYSSVKNEHLSVLTGAGIFDTSHMATIMLTGPGAHDLLQWCFTNDLSKCVGKDKKPISDGRCVYGIFLDEAGRVIDDSIIYRIEKNHYMVVINAGMGPTLRDHLAANKGAREVEIVDLKDTIGKVDVQGPNAAKLLTPLLENATKTFEGLSYFSFKGYFDRRYPFGDQVCLKDGTSILLSRTGYTGEFGFEIFVFADRLLSLWDKMMNLSTEFSALACGLAARDSLRAGAMLPLSHQDIGPWPFINNPWVFALPFKEDKSGFTKQFVGAQALLDIQAHEYTYAFIGSDLRKVSTAGQPVVLDSTGSVIGKVLTCVTEMGIGLHEGRACRIGDPGAPRNFVPRGLSCGFVKVNHPLVPGDRVSLQDHRRKIEVVITKDIRPNRTARKPIQQML